MNIFRPLNPNKSWRQLLVVLLFGILLFSLALFTVPIHAQTTGLVTCGLQHGTGTETAFCTICDLIVLIQNIMNKAMYVFAAPIAAFMLGYGGFLMVWAGVKGGDTGMYGKGKTVMTNALIGIVIIFSSWLLIDTLMKGLGAYQYATSANFGPWNKIECSAPPISLPKHMGCEGDVCKMIDGSGSATCTNSRNCKDKVHNGCADNKCVADAPGVGTDNCMVGDDSSCVKPPAGNGLPICTGVPCEKDSFIDTYKPNLAADCTIRGDWESAITNGIGMAGAGSLGADIDTYKMVKAIIAKESNGNISKPSPAGACGLMQIKPESGKRFANRCGTTEAEASTCSFYSNPANAAKSICIGTLLLGAPEVASQCGRTIRGLSAGFNGGGGGSKSACAPSLDCGSALKADECSMSSQQTGETKRWECQWNDAKHTTCNTGYTETRNYVPNVLGCYNKF